MGQQKATEGHLTHYYVAPVSTRVAQAQIRSYLEALQSSCNIKCTELLNAHDDEHVSVLEEALLRHSVSLRIIINIY